MQDNSKISGFSLPSRRRTPLRIDDEKLIELVRENNAIYNTEHCKYADLPYREKMWKLIGAELKQSPFICKKRWSNIRDNYKKNLKRIAEKGEYGRTKMRRYKYSSQLDFLGCTLENRKKGNVSPSEFKAEVDFETTQDSESVDIISDSETDEEKCFQSQTEDATPYPEEINKDQQSEMAKLMRCMVDKIETEIRTGDRHPVDAFLAGIAPTLKSLSAYYLSLAKTQIYSIVQEYEMAMLVENNKNERDQT